MCSCVCTRARTTLCVRPAMQAQWRAPPLRRLSSGARGCAAGAGRTVCHVPPSPACVAFGCMSWAPSAAPTYVRPTRRPVQCRLNALTAAPLVQPRTRGHGSHLGLAPALCLATGRSAQGRLNLGLEVRRSGSTGEGKCGIPRRAHIRVRACSRRPRHRHQAEAAGEHIRRPSGRRL